MLDENHQRQLRKKGFLIVPGVLTAEEVRNLRMVSDRIFSEPSPHHGDVEGAGSIGSVRFDVFGRYPELRWLLFHPPIVAALRSLLGNDFICVPEAALHDSGFGTWHKDTFAQERDGHRFAREKSYLMVEAAIYLQDNTQYGGGLDVVPGSHRKLTDNPIDFDPTKMGQARLKLRNRLRDKFFRHSIPSKAGDLVIFDFRIDHRATPASVKLEPPPDQRKRALFWACGRNDPTTMKYIQYIKSRQDYVYLQEHSYPSELLDKARSLGLKMPSGNDIAAH